MDEVAVGVSNHQIDEYRFNTGTELDRAIGSSLLVLLGLGGHRHCDPLDQQQPEYRKK